MTPKPLPRGAIVLAGGYSTRMGRDKASLPLGDDTMLGCVLRALAPAVSEIVLVTRRGQAAPDVPAMPASTVLRRVHDEAEGLGPLGGLAPGLRALEAPVAFVTGCDTPFLTAEFVGVMFDALGDADVALPSIADHLEPLAGVYRRSSVLPAVGALIAAGHLRTLDLFERLHGVRVPEAVLRVVDPDLRSLENLNDPAAYDAARRRLGSSFPPGTAPPKMSTASETPMSHGDEDPNHSSDVRALRYSFLLGVVAGLGHGIPRYGFFSIGNVGMVGLGIIVIVGLHAAFIALMPPRGTGTDSDSRP